jgi:hypothetical protein
LTWASGHSVSNQLERNWGLDRIYLGALWVTPEGLITDVEPDEAVEAGLPYKDKTINLTRIPVLDQPTIVTPNGETLVFVRDLPGSASAILREKTSHTLKEDESDDTEETVEAKEKKGKGNEPEDAGEFESF